MPIEIAPKTVLRGGFGIFYEATSNGGCGCTLGANGSFAQISDGLSAPFQWDGGIPKPPGYQPPPFLTPNAGNGLSVDYMGPTFGMAPRIYTFSGNLQREIARFLIDVEYQGNRGYRLNSTVDLNQVNPSYLYLGSLLAQNITAPAVVAAGFSKPYPNFNGTLAQALRPYPAVPERLFAQQRPGPNLVRFGEREGDAPFRQLAVHRVLRPVEDSRLAHLPPDLLAEPGLPAGYVQPEPGASRIFRSISRMCSTSSTPTICRSEPVSASCPARTAC